MNPTENRKREYKNTISGLTEMLTPAQALQRNYVNDRVRNASRWEPTQGLETLMAAYYRQEGK